MQKLFHASGAQDLQILEERFTPIQWETHRGRLKRLLEKRKEVGAMRLLERFPWSVREGTNNFGDEFQTLFAYVSLDAYADNAHLPQDPNARAAAAVLAAAVEETSPGVYIRHIAYALDTNEQFEHVEAPNPVFTSALVKKVLADADRLLIAGDAVSAVDRIHTAFVGYLRLACKENGVEFSETDSLNALLKKLTKGHPGLSEQPHAEHVGKVLRASSTILDAFDPLRNRASIAHANENLLNEPEARLVANIARSLMHYFDARLA